MPEQAQIQLNVFDGTRQPFRGSVGLLVTLRDGFQKVVHRKTHKAASIKFDVDFFNNLGDSYAVIVSAKGHKQAGFHPVKVTPMIPQTVDLMLLPENSRFNFAEATWDKLQTQHKKFADILGHSAADATEAEGRYDELMDTAPETLAGFLNIATATRDVLLPTGKALDYFKEVIWDQELFQRDRFHAFADAELIRQVQTAAGQGQFDPQFGLELTHPGATTSFKQKQFGEANVQFSFHEKTRKKIDGVDCVKVEMDIDYFRDPLAHFFLEVLINHVSHSLTDPKQVYVLRWIAGRHAGVPEFNPPYTIEARA